MKEGHPSSKCRNRKKCTIDDCVNWHPVPVHGIFEELYPNRSSSSSKESKEDIPSNKKYAQESVLSWCIVGNAVPSDKYIGRTLKTHVQHDSSIQKPHILKKNHFAQLAKILESDFIESKSDGKVMSQADMVFMRMVEQSIHLYESGYYEIKLLFCDAAAMNMPNNRIVVEKRLEYLKQRMAKNQQYHKDY